MYESKNVSTAGTPENSSNPISPVQENQQFEDSQFSDISQIDRSHLNKINKLSDLTINEDITDDELVNMYKETDVLEEQADILHYLFYNKFVLIFVVVNNNLILNLTEILIGRLAFCTMISV